VIIDPDTQIKQIDPMTVSFTVAKPGYGFTLLSLLANVTGYIYDSTLLKQHATPSDPWAVDYSSNNPNIGFGAYERTSYIPGTSMVLTANPNYALAAPYYKKITFVVTADPGSRANAAKNNNAQVAVQLNPADQITLGKTAGVRVFTFPSTNMLTMFTMDTLSPPFNDVKVRQAMALAIPYSQIQKNVYYSRAISTVSVFDPTGDPNYIATGLHAPTYDPAKAMQILSAAGHPNGISFTLTVSNAVPDVQLAAIQVQSYAAAAGFHITISQQPAAAVSAGITSRVFPAYMWRDMAISSSPQYELNLFFQQHSQTDPGPAASNSSGWVNAQYLNDINQGAALPDPTSPQANVFWNEAQQITQDQVPQIYVGRIQPLNAFRSNVTGYANRLDNDIDYSMLAGS
jgi:peptide/nickel transport system substrate-binding protein